ncbi:MAG: hypothetical protein ACO1RX_09660 [Candidatus Sericytochromatia bacterium]
MVSFDATILIQLINFLILLLILTKVFFQPIIKVQKERQAAMEAARQSTDKKHAELRQLQSDHQRKLDEARQEAFALVSARIDQANTERESRLAEVQAEIDARLNAAKEELSQQESALRQSLQQEIAPLAELIFAKLVGAPAQEEKKEVSVL